MRAISCWLVPLSAPFSSPCAQGTVARSKARVWAAQTGLARGALRVRSAPKNGATRPLKKGSAAPAPRPWTPLFPSPNARPGACVLAPREWVGGRATDTPPLSPQTLTCAEPRAGADDVTDRAPRAAMDAVRRREASMWEGVWRVTRAMGAPKRDKNTRESVKKHSLQKRLGGCPIVALLPTPPTHASPSLLYIREEVCVSRHTERPSG